MKKLILLVLVFGSSSFAASGPVIKITGSQAEILFTNLEMENLLAGESSGVQSFSSASMGPAGRGNTIITTFEKKGSEADLSCWQSSFWNDKTETFCEYTLKK